MIVLTGDVEAAYDREVTREGFIVIPQVGQVQVANLTLGQVEDVLYSRLGRVYSGVRRGAGATTRFSVSPARLRSNQIYVLGDVQRPASYRISAAGTHKIGFAELRVGVPFPAWALEIARWGTRPANFQEVIYFGRSYDPEGAMARGLVDEIVDGGELMARARSAAERLAAIPPVSFRLMKEAMRRPVVERVRASEAADKAVREAWGSDEVRAAIRRFLKETFGTDTR